MIIDFHTHCFPCTVAAEAIKNVQADICQKAYLKGTNDDLLASMGSAGITLSVNLPVATNPTKVESMNRRLAEYNACQNSAVLNFGCMHPECDVKQRIKELAELGLKGFKLHPYFHKSNFNSRAYLDLLAYAGEFNLIVVTHAGEDITFPGQSRCTAAMIAEVIKSVGPVKLVLAHMGGYGNWNEIYELAMHDNIFLDTSFSMGQFRNMNGERINGLLPLLTEGNFCELVKQFGSEHILFGSDSPWYDQSEAVSIMSALPLSLREKENIFCNNGKQLLNI